MKNRKNIFIKRYLPLGLLAAVIAFVVVKFGSFWPNEVILKLKLEPQLAKNLSKLETTVYQNSRQEIISHSVFIFDDKNPAPEVLKHNLRLVDGKYLINYDLVFQTTNDKKTIERELAISSSTEVVHFLP